MTPLERDVAAHSVSAQDFPLFVEKRFDLRGRRFSRDAWSGVFFGKLFGRLGHDFALLYLFFEKKSNDFLDHLEFDAPGPAMAHEAEIRDERVFIEMLSELPEHPAFCFGPQNTEMREAHKSQKVDALVIFSYGNFPGVQIQFQVLAEKRADLLDIIEQHLFVAVQNHEVIAVADVAFRPQRHFHELIQLIQVDICEKLARKVAERQSLSRIRGEAVDDDPKKLKNALVVNPIRKQCFQNIVINGAEKAFDVTLQRPHRPCVVPGQRPPEFLKAAQRRMGTLALAACVRIKDETRIEYGFDGADDGMVQYPVDDGRFVDMPFLRIEHEEGLVRAMLIFFLF
jgi:hypothetical protein